MSLEIHTGMSPTETPYPEELELGNIVKLKRPYRASMRASGHAGEPYTHGIIVEQLHRNAFGMPLLSLHLYNPETLEIYVGPNGIPNYVDHAADELLLWKVASEGGYLICRRDGSRGGTLRQIGDTKHHEATSEDELGWDMHPPCRDGHTKEWSHPFGDNAECEHCRGWGYEREHRPFKQAT